MLHLARDVFDEAQSIDADLCVNEWADVLHADDVVRAAIRVRDRYFSHIQKLLDTYGIENEAQLVSGQLSNLRNRLTEQDKDDYSYYNTDKVVQLRYAQVFTRFREIFFEVRQRTLHAYTALVHRSTVRSMSTSRRRRAKFKRYRCRCGKRRSCGTRLHIV
jgi:hypothetical protein